MYDAYTNYIKSFINEDIRTWTFKSSPEYRIILEHCTEEHGNQYIAAIQERFGELYERNKGLLVDICRANDIYGNTIKCDFANFTTCSPSNLRYILHSFLVLSYMKACMLKNVDIIEIGGGYGGLCFFLHKLAGLFEITIDSYSIFDLEEPSLLQKKYLEGLGIVANMNFLHIDSVKNLKKNSFLVSNYAFSEISMDLQKRYTADVLNPYTSHGFLAWNFIDMYNFIDNKKISVEREYPSSAPNNRYVRFQP
jgi:hypothetical protein